MRRWFGVVRIAASVALFCAAALLLWRAVHWTLQPGWVLWADEIGNLARYLTTPYSEFLTILPHWIYNDRPVGFFFERILFNYYGLDYYKQVPWLLAVHFCNCGLALLLFRKVGLGLPLSIAGVGVFGSLITSASTATYLGAAFDVLSLFLLLLSMLSLTLGRWGCLASAICFFLALRTKEFVIGAPVLLSLFLATRRGRYSLREMWADFRRYLWPHYLIAAVFAVRYAGMFATYRAQVPRSGPYYLDLNLGTLLKSLAFYTAYIAGAHDRLTSGVKIVLDAAIMATILYGLVRRRMALLFSMASFILLLVPVGLLPNVHAPFYVYAPQLFLILAVLVLLSDTAAAFCRRRNVRWIFEMLLAGIILWGAARFQSGAYARNIVNFTRNVRSVVSTTATDVRTQLPKIGRNSHIYISHGKEQPWLFNGVPCAFLKLLYHEPELQCVSGESEDALVSAYTQDPAEKYFIDYLPDGHIRLRGSHVPGQDRAAERRAKAARFFPGSVLRGLKGVGSRAWGPGDGDSLRS